jgi:apolipoprotein N-acyltransferase
LTVSVCAILVFSIPGAILLVFVVFPHIFKIIGELPFNKAVLKIFLFNMFIVLIIFLNKPFINYFPLLVIAVVYFGVMITLDFVMLYYLSRLKEFNIIAIFLYVVLSRAALSLSVFVFPFYWTITMQLLPGMDLTAYFILPVFLEGIVVSSANIYNLVITKHSKASVAIQSVFIILVCIVATKGVRENIDQEERIKSLNCGIIQLAFSNKDFTLASKYYKLSEKITLSYLQNIKKNKTAQLIILPESAFPIQQDVDGNIVQKIRGMASEQNQYILASLKIEENSIKFNAIHFVTPKGEIAGIYKKRNVVPFVENYEYAKGKELNTFAIEGYTVAPLICFDSVFIRNYFRDKKPDLYVVTSNDIFSEHTILSLLHEAYGVLNARTLGIPLIQATQNGPSFYVDYAGKLNMLANLYERSEVITFTVKDTAQE